MGTTLPRVSRRKRMVSTSSAERRLRYLTARDGAAQLQDSSGEEADCQGQVVRSTSLAQQHLACCCSSNVPGFLGSLMHQEPDGRNIISDRTTCFWLLALSMQADPENTVGVLSMAGGKGVRVLVTPTADLGKILSSMHGM